MINIGQATALIVKGVLATVLKDMYIVGIFAKDNSIHNLCTLKHRRILLVLGGSLFFDGFYILLDFLVYVGEVSANPFLLF